MVLGLSLIGLTGCGGSDDAPTATEAATATVTSTPSVSAEPTTASTPEAPAAEPIQFRYVMASDYTPCGDGDSSDVPSVAPRTGRSGARDDGTRPRPTPRECRDFAAASCPAPAPPSVAVDESVVLCEGPVGTPDSDRFKPAVKYLLSPALIVGGVVDASAGIPQGQTRWAISLQLGGRSKKVFTEISRTWTYDVDQFAMVVDGAVLSAPTFFGPITGGQAQISGDFTEDEAIALAAAIKAGG